MRRLLSVALILLSLAATACQDEGTIRVNSLTFHGVNAVSESRLREALATRQGSKIPWSRKRYFNQAAFDADLKRLQAFYEDRGFPDARVTNADVKFNKNKDGVDLTVTIVEGEPVQIASVTFEGFDTIPEDHLKKLEGDVPLKIGRPRDRQLVLTAHEMALNELRDHGYPYAKVATAEDDGPRGREATIKFVGESGPEAHFGVVKIEAGGKSSVGKNVIERELGFKQGDLFRRSLLQNAQRRLYGMELFQLVIIKPESADVEQQNTEVDTVVQVIEGKHQHANVGVGYGTEEKARIDAEYHHVNFLGAARSAGVHGRWSSLDRGLRADFTQPYFFGPHFSFGAEAQHWYTYTPAYNSIATGGRINVTHRESARMSWAAFVSSEQTSSTIAPDVLDDPELRDDLIALGLDPTTGKQEGLLNSIGFDIQRSTADNLLNATRGYQLGFHTEESGGWLPGDFNFYTLSADGRYYKSLGDRLVIAGRLQLGNIAAASGNEANVPFSRKFFLGGAGSVRGWGRYEVSPLGTSGLPIGGNSLMAVSLEARAHLTGNLGGVLFVDAGNVWADPWSIDPGDLRYAIGPGLRYQTPVGPIRFDFGYQLNPIPGLIVNDAPQSHRFRIHFSIGQAF